MKTVKSRKESITVSQISRRLCNLEYRVLLTLYGRELVDSMCKSDKSTSMEWLDHNIPGWRTRTEPPEAVNLDIIDNGDDDDE